MNPHDTRYDWAWYQREARRNELYRRLRNALIAILAGTLLVLAAAGVKPVATQITSSLRETVARVSECVSPPPGAQP